nr:MAG TPA: hypothetical protein [Caudoviricetes sp.]
MMKKNYFIEQMNKTEDGRQYLADCKRLNNTKIDADGLKKRFQTQ